MFKFTKPPNEYVLIRYRNGETIGEIPIHWYMTTKEAYRNWKQHGAEVRIEHWFDNKYYKLSAGANIFVYEMGTSFSLLIQQYLEKKNPTAWAYWSSKKQWQEAAPIPVKSEPKPDDYYFVKHSLSGSWRVVLRKPWDSGHVGQGQFIFWDKADSNTVGMVNRPDSAPYWPINNKKFPQLSSETKTELQKLNPERYKQWEDFYLKKYPNMKPLNTLPKYPFKTNDLSQLEIHCQGGFAYAFIRDKRYPTVIWKSKSKDNFVGVSPQEFGIGKWRSWNLLKSDVKHIVKAYQPELHDKFEQYYSEIEQKKVTKVNPTAPNAFVLIQVGSDFYITEPDRANSSDYINVGFWKNNYVAIVQPSKGINHGPFNKLPGPIREQLFKLNNSRFNEWVDFYQKESEKGSDLDIDQQALGESYHKAVQSLISKEGSKIGKILAFGIGESDEDYSGLQSMFTDPKSYNIAPSIGKTGYFSPTYSVGFDPYLPQQDEVCVSIWGKNLHSKLINRLTELESEQAYRDFASYYWENRNKWTPQEYHNMIMNSPVEAQGVAWLKPRRVGQAKFHEELMEASKYYGINMLFEKPQFYTPNLKQQNDEIINVPRKTITITSGEKCTGNSISSFRCPPAITEKHIGNRAQPCTGKTIPGGCKIG